MFLSIDMEGRLMPRTQRKEVSVTQTIITQLDNLGWIVGERDRECNVFQQRAKTEAQREALRGREPDFVLYQRATNRPIGIIEAKKPNLSLARALDQPEDLVSQQALLSEKLTRGDSKCNISLANLTV